MKKVKQRTSYECIYEDDEIVEQILKSFAIYDDAGNLIEGHVYSPEGEVAQIEKHTYEDGKVITSSHEDVFNEALQRTTYQYEDDRIVLQRDHFNDVDFIETWYEYDAQHRVTVIRRQDNESVSQGHTTFEYSGDTTTEREYNEDGQLVSVQEYRTDEHGNIIENTRTEFSGKNALTMHEEISFRDQKTLSEIRRYRGDTLIFSAQNVFDENGRRIRTVIKDYLNPKETERVFAYGDEDRVIKEEYLENGHLMRSREVEYDVHGEVIEETFRQRLYEDYFQPSTNRFEIVYY